MKGHHHKVRKLRSSENEKYDSEESTLFHQNSNPSLTMTSKKVPPHDGEDEEEEAEILIEKFNCLSDSTKTLFLSTVFRDHLSQEILSPLYMSLQPLLRQDFLSILPVELSFEICAYLDLTSLVQSLLVNKSWTYLILKNDRLWKKLWRKEFGIEKKDFEEEKVSKKKFQNKTKEKEFLSFPNSLNNSSSLPKCNKFLEQINRSRKLRYSWNQGDPKMFSFECHNSSVITNLHLVPPNRVISASDDGTLKVWCTLTGQCLATCSGHVGGVWAMHVLGPYLLSGSTDRSLRLWKWSNGDCLGILKGHGSTVRCAALYINPESSNYEVADTDSEDDENMFDHRTSSSLDYLPMAVSGSRDQTLRIWDLKTMTTKHVLYGHSSSIRALAIRKHFLVSASYDSTARIWDLRTKQCLNVLLGHTDKLYTVALSGNYVATAGLDAKIHLWNIHTGLCINTLEGHRGLVGQLEFLSKNILLSSGSDGYIREWNIQGEGECTQRWRSENGAGITCFHAGHSHLVAGFEKYLRLWDLNDKRLGRNLVIGLDTVWRVTFDESVCVAACQVNGQAFIYVIRFQQDLL